MEGTSIQGILENVVNIFFFASFMAKCHQWQAVGLIEIFYKIGEN